MTRQFLGCGLLGREAGVCCELLLRGANGGGVGLVVSSRAKRQKCRGCTKVWANLRVCFRKLDFDLGAAPTPPLHQPALLPPAQQPHFCPQHACLNSTPSCRALTPAKATHRRDFGEDSVAAALESLHLLHHNTHSRTHHSTTAKMNGNTSTGLPPRSRMSRIVPILSYPHLDTGRHSSSKDHYVC
jgi:hypothetical protein